MLFLLDILLEETDTGTSSTDVVPVMTQPPVVQIPSTSQQTDDQVYEDIGSCSGSQNEIKH